MTKMISKDVIHEKLECHRGVGEAEGHDHKFIMAIVSMEHDLKHTNDRNLNLMVPWLQVNLSKNLGSLHFVKQFLIDKNKEFIFYGSFVERMIIHLKL